MKKLLTYIIVVLWILVGNYTFAQNSWTMFDVDETIFDVTNFSATDNSTIHFGTWISGNSFGWAIFWWPKVDKEISLNMNWNIIHCKKQMRGFYVNQARWNVMWPLDTTTLWTFKWKLNWYQNLSINWWFFTNCTWDMITDYNWIYGYIKHTTIDGHEYELRAWFDYRHWNILNNWWDSLWQELNLDTKEFFIKWVLYDSYGWIGFIDSVFNNPLIIRNASWGSIDLTIKSQPQKTTLWWNVKFELSLDNKFDYYIENIKVYVIIPENIDWNWDEIWDFSDNKLTLYEWPLYPLQSRKFTFEWTAIDAGAFTATWIFQSYWLDVQDIVVITTWFIQNTQFVLDQNTTVDEYTIIDDDISFDITFENKWNISGSNILLLDYLPDTFVYTDDAYERYNEDKNILLLFSGLLYPWETFSGQVNGYFMESGNFENIIKAKWNEFNTIVNNLSVKIFTNICGDGILDEEYEYCDDWEDNGTFWHCNDTCTNIKWAWVACKYTDANYLSNWPFSDTLNHWWFDYIETMRKSCLHRWKWGFANQWKYDPDEYITKAEVLKTLVKIRWIAFDDFDIVNEDTTYDWVQVFSDVSKNHRFSWYAFYAFDHGLTDELYAQKWDKRLLYPDWKITRNQIIKAIMTLYKEIIDDSEIDISGESKMIDIAKWSSYYYQYVREAEELWIISWYEMPNGTKTWQWNNSLTRAEFAKIVSIPFAELLFDS